MGEITTMTKTKLLTALMAVVFTFMVMPLAFSAQTDISVTIDGTPVNFSGIGPQIVQDRTLVPARGVFEALGFDVEWYAPAQRVTLTRHDYTITLTVGSSSFTTNDIAHALEVPAQIISDSTFLPLRHPIESIGYSLDWCGNTRTVLIITTESAPESAAPQEASNTSELERRVLELVNIERGNHNVSPLEWNDLLAAAARLHSEDMSTNNFFSHTGSDNSNLMDRINRVGYNFSSAAENLAGSMHTPEQAVQAWMNSEGHRRNILNPDFTELGAGIYNFIWTLNFAAPR